MASSLPSTSDCCSACSGVSVSVSTMSVRQVYSGSGDPNGVVIPDDQTIDNLYYNLDTPGEIWFWNPAELNWI